MRTIAQINTDIVTLAYRMAGTWEAFSVAAPEELVKARAKEYAGQLNKLHAERLAVLYPEKTA